MTESGRPMVPELPPREGSPPRGGRERAALSRRQFFGAAAGFGGLCGAVPALASEGMRMPEPIDEFIQRKMEADRIPGVAAALVDRGGVVWARGYGWADLERRVPYLPDTLQNVASISKTFTTAAAMQLVEAERLELDRDVSDYLPFPVRNPNHPAAPITVRHLVTHTSSLHDGTWYARSYACGDPTVGLERWVREYLSPGGEFHEPRENFHPWEPGGRWEYANITFGLLALLVETVSGQAFADYSRAMVFGPAGLAETSWWLREIDPSRHAVPYAWVEGGQARGPSWGGLPLGVVGEARVPGSGEGFVGSCLYSHPNYPDGFLRSSVRQLARWVGVYLNGGELEGRVLLRPETVERLFTSELVAGARTQGLTWSADGAVGGEPAWGHGGSDPGVNNDIRLLRSRGLAAVVLTNTNGIRPAEITTRILQEAV
jgi:CubicO group peptidase (beta-lactamase class C family)